MLLIIVHPDCCYRAYSFSIFDVSLVLSVSVLVELAHNGRAELYNRPRPIRLNCQYWFYQVVVDVISFSVDSKPLTGQIFWDRVLPPITYDRLLFIHEPVKYYSMLNFEKVHKRYRTM